MLTRPPGIPARFILGSLPRNLGSRRVLVLLAGAVLTLFCGCTSFSEWVNNGFKVGPNYHKPPAPVASEWIDSQARGVNIATQDLACWWAAFNDPKLNELVEQAYRQNLTLRSAGTRILAARAQRGIAVGSLFPQAQQAVGNYIHSQTSKNVANVLPNRIFDDHLVAGGFSWELDFWGRFRRGIEAASAELDATVENYDDALVVLISEVASTYVQIRIFQQRLRYIASNVAIQTELAQQAEDRLKGGIGRKIDVGQMRSNLYDTLGLKEQFEIGLRQANNALCVLLGIPVRDLVPDLGPGEIPVAPPEVAVGMPADLLRRRPDVRRAERLVAAQSARIGIATSDLYPRISLVGALGYEAQNFSNLFSPGSFIGAFGPTLRWDVLNYGRLLNAIRIQDAQFQTAVVDYQNLVLSAGREVEDSLVLFLRSQSRTRQLTVSSDEARVAAEEAVQLSKDVKFDLNRAFVTTNFLVQQQDKVAQARGDIALGLIQIYRALGGGWQIRLPAPAPPAPPPAPAPGTLPDPAPGPVPAAGPVPAPVSGPATGTVYTPRTLFTPAGRSVQAAPGQQWESARPHATLGNPAGQ